MGAMAYVLLAHVSHSVKLADHVEDEGYLLAWEIDMGHKSATMLVKIWRPAIYYLSYKVVVEKQQ